MIIATSTLRRAPLYARHQSGQGALLGYIQKFLYHVGTAKLEKLIVQKGRFSGFRALYETSSLEVIRGRAYIKVDNKKKMSVDSVGEESIPQPLEHLRVYTRSGMFVGTVDDVYVDDSSFTMMQLEVVKRVFIFPLVMLLITRQDILDILPHKIVVRDAVLEEADLMPLFSPKGHLRRMRAESNI